MVRRRIPPPGPTKLRNARVAGFTLTEGVHPAGSSLPWHAHEGPTICYLLEGAFVEVTGGKSVTCTPATLKFTPAGDRHCDRFELGDAHGLLIEADPARVETLRTHSAVLEDRSVFHGGVPAGIAKRIYEELRLMDQAAPLAIEGLLLELLALTSRSTRSSFSPDRPAWLAEVRDMIHSDPAARRSLGELAGAVGVHPVTLARAFRKAFGCSVGEYVRRLRIERAAAQLGASDTSLAEIALAAGFADQSHFSNVFRRQTGMSPSGFRRTVRGR
jgi:AraC family transcriptional regulator